MRPPKLSMKTAIKITLSLVVYLFSYGHMMASDTGEEMGFEAQVAALISIEAHRQKVASDVIFDRYAGDYSVQWMQFCTANESIFKSSDPNVFIANCLRLRCSYVIGAYSVRFVKAGGSTKVILLSLTQAIEMVKDGDVARDLVYAIGQVANLAKNNKEKGLDLAELQKSISALLLKNKYDDTIGIDRQVKFISE